MVCDGCQKEKRGKYFYSYYAAEDRLFFCDQCHNAILKERNAVESSSKDAFGRQEIVAVLKKSIRELDNMIEYERAVAGRMFDAEKSNEHSRIIIAPLLREKAVKEFKLRLLTAPDNTPKSNSFDIEMIKNIDPALVIGKQIPRGANICCPIHKEKTPSFRWYHTTKSFYCFGCHESGSVIDLVMKLDNCDFKTACQELQKYL